MRIIVAITGASGTILALRLMEELKTSDHETHVIFTKGAAKVAEFELKDSDIEKKIQDLATKIYDEDNIAAPIASGSYPIDAMVIIPCSMKTLSAVANAYSDNLITRAADLAITHKRKLVIVPRETPFNQLHLKNMLTLSKAGAYIVPPVMAYYHDPKTASDMTDFAVGKVLDCLGIENNLYRRWGK